ncbi:MAG TPA: TAXI family TRAP transporter solute-binding subunit [Smithellaceae bacterium]|nr:TAXI family TRAP transporter solute-binding subunit [Smithellaceae bacterium]HRS82438.1 TAXI family TRAP transporter solute-binding subunit [Smithellaceae bacterium]HRV44344.1 TAXI family TRAP transporter solute-binding subunit [Smithellaceae bacterium]
MKAKFYSVVGAFLFCVLVSAGTVQGEVLKNVKFLSGPTGTTWYSQVAAFSGIASGKLGMNVDAMTGSAISNVIQIERGKVPLGLTFASYLPAMTSGKVVAQIGKDEYFKEPVKKARVLCYTTTAAYVLLVDAKSPYKKISDLKGKPIRYVTYPSGFTARYVPEQILEATGITYDGIKKAGGKVDIVGKYQEACDLLSKGLADVIAYTMATNAQAAALAELESQKKFRILALDPKPTEAVLKEIPLLLTTVKKGLHASITEDTKVLADITVWMVSADVSDETVTVILDGLVKNMDTMAQVGNIEFKGMTAKELSRLYGKGKQPPMHPAALKFYKEKGAVK